MVLETKTWMLRVLIATGVSSLLGPFSYQRKKTHVCILTCDYTMAIICGHESVEYADLIEWAMLPQWQPRNSQFIPLVHSRIDSFTSY